MNQNIHQCSQCKNNFPEQEVYRIGIKQKDFFCRDCAKNIKSECMWCGKELEQKKWKILGGWWEVKSEEGNLTETINRENYSGEKHHKYYLTCEETREHGMRLNQSCPSRVNDWWVEKGNQSRQEKKSKGWKECQGKAVYLKDNGNVLFDMNCWKLVPPGGGKYCKDERCIYFAAVYNGTVSEKEKRIKERWNQHTQEKYQRANEWWNSLSLVQKQAELKKEEEHLNNLGLQRQRCWIENIDKNSILFENGKLRYYNMDKIPPSFLDRFGLPGFQWESVWKNDSNHSNALQTKVAINKEINQKEISLQQAKESGENELAVQLEKQIQELRKQKQDNLSVKNENPNKTAIYLTTGLVSFFLIGLVFVIAKLKGRKPKTKL